VIDRKEGCGMIEYNKSRACTNYSFHVVRYFPEPVNFLIILYLVYIRPFAKALYRSLLLSQREIERRRKSSSKKIPYSISKRAGQRRVKRRLFRDGKSINIDGSNRDNDALDRGYIFCSDESPNKCWTGVELSEILQEESLKELGVRINLWAWRHIIIGIAKAHLQEIAPFFDKNEKACQTMLETNTYTMIFPWLAGHQWAINVSVYGLDSAFPGKIQPELLSFYRRIAKIWHYWLGLSKPEGALDGLRMIRDRKRRLLMDENEQDEDHLPAEKRPKLIDAETQTTP
jgi:hypothetical protein